jgi:hypothetical protein
MRWLEILGAVALVATVGALIIGAIRHAQHAAAQAQCHNCLKQVALATHSYHDANKRYPRAIVSIPTVDFPPEKHVSWYFDISHYMVAHMDPDWLIDPKKPYDDRANQYVFEHDYLSYLIRCPAGASAGSDPHFASYVGITGVGKDAAWFASDDPKAGVFGYTRVVRTNDLKAGSANVILVMETATDNGHWAIGGHTTARGLDPNGASYFGGQGQFNSHHGGFLYAFTTQAAMADASVRTFTDDTADHVLESLATLAGR